jgi:ABC-type polysaccharide/polyol phosphate export permease
VILIQLVFTSGLALALAALTVHFRDIRDILSNVLMLWFFSTPIIYAWYQEEMLPYRRFFNLNPFTHLAVSYQEILFFPGAFAHWRWLVALGAASIAVFLAGYWLFDRLRDSFAEVA